MTLFLTGKKLNKLRSFHRQKAQAWKLSFPVVFSHRELSGSRRESHSFSTALYLFNIVTRTRRHTELTNLMGNLCCARENSVWFSVLFFFWTVKLHSLTVQFNLECMGLFKVSPRYSDINPSAWGHLNRSSYCDVGRLFYGVFKLWSKLQRKKWRNNF